jgi:hypothetical protein
MNPSWNVETTTRFCAAVIGCAATPVLVGLACARWIKGIRRELPRWRNGDGTSFNGHYFRTLAVPNHALDSLGTKP